MQAFNIAFGQVQCSAFWPSSKYHGARQTFNKVTSTFSSRRHLTSSGCSRRLRAINDNPSKARWHPAAVRSVIYWPRLTVPRVPPFQRPTPAPGRRHSTTSTSNYSTPTASTPSSVRIGTATTIAYVYSSKWGAWLLSAIGKRWLDVIVRFGYQRSLCHSLRLAQRLGYQRPSMVKYSHFCAISTFSCSALGCKLEEIERRGKTKQRPDPAPSVVYRQILPHQPFAHQDRKERNGRYGPKSQFNYFTPNEKDKRMT